MAEDVQVQAAKKERPQNKNLKPLGTGRLSPEEELAIRRKGNAASQKARRRNADIRAAVRSIANLNTRGRAKSIDVEKLISLEQLNEEGAPLISQLVYVQFEKALHGDNEARDWICRMLGVENLLQEAAGLTVTADADALEQPGGVRIHLIRGEKPAETPSEEELATQAANRLAIVEALRAAGEAASTSGDVTPVE